MVIQNYPDELDYVNAQIAKAAGSKSFLSTFGDACLRADDSNYEVLRAALHFFMRKYPADPERLAAERRDRETQKGSG